MITQPATDVENLKRSWEHLWQRPCANTTSISVAKIQPLRPDAERTCQRAVREVEFCDVVAKLANIQWECEALIVAESELRNDAFRLHANNLEGQLAFAHTPSRTKSARSVGALSTDAELTSQIVVAEVDLCHRIAELANVGRKHQSCVSFQLNGAVLDEFPAQKSNRNFA